MATTLDRCLGRLAARDPELAACYSPNATQVVLGSGGSERTGPKAIVTEHDQLAAAFSDLVFERQLTLIQGRDVFVVLLVRGTQRANLAIAGLEVPSKRKPLGVLVLVHQELDDAFTIVRERWIYDAETVRGQLTGSAKVRVATTTAAATGPTVVSQRDQAESANIFALNQRFQHLTTRDDAWLAQLAGDAVLFESTERTNATGIAAIQQRFAARVAATPDLQLQPLRVWTARDYSVAEVRQTGTDARTKRPIDLLTFEIARWKDGRIAAIWSFTNGAQQRAQLAPSN